MNEMKVFVLQLLLFIIPIAAFAQGPKNITLEEIYLHSTFQHKTISGLRSMADGLHYTTLQNRTKVVKYAYESGKEVAVLIDVVALENCPVRFIEGYELSQDETKMLIYTHSESIYRHSFKAEYYVYDIERKEISPLSDEGKQQVASFSPDGEKVAFVRDNNLFLKKLKFNTESAITKDGEMNHILNGIPDWVYEEEFSFKKAYEWSPNSEEIAFIRFDESQVKQFAFPEYMASHPAREEYELYPGQYEFKYPKAGEANSSVSVHVFNLRNRTTKQMDTGEETDIYIPRIRWTRDAGKLAILKLNRRQNQLDVLVANTATTLTGTIFTDRNEKYIGEDVLDNLHFLEDGKHFVYVGEQDGYNHIYMYTMAGSLVRQVTSGSWDVTNYYGYESRKKMFYYQAAEESPLTRSVYAISLDGKKKYRLSEQEGTNSAVFSKGFKYFINTFSSTSTPALVTLHKQDGTQKRVLEDNLELKERLKNYSIRPKEFFSFTTSEGIDLNGWMVKPADYSPNKKYPVFMTQYSGPNSQQVKDSWRVSWEQVIASKGYIVVCVDPRGTAARGEAFRKSTYMKLGELESDDQIEAAKYLGGLDYVDASRIGIYGWSYGGFMSALCLSKTNVFKIGIAVAPVTDWRYYDSVYTERYMRKPQENGNGYRDNSPTHLAGQLQGRLFLIHGTADDNVHFQNTMEYVDRLVQAGKQFDMFAYPNRAHGLNGGNTRLHVQQMMLDYIIRNL
jgi:dipeptidyl-peptidase-4